MVPSPSRALRSTATTLLPMVALILLVSPGAWAQDGRAKGGISAEAAGCPIGVYVTSLRDLDPVGDSFSAFFLVINAIVIVLAAVAG
jgi:formate hydrogenlyase subunit 3/multisubunit Na+/H+ antiporter MnhD subunit